MVSADPTAASRRDVLHHVGVVVSDLDPAVHFFVTWFGARVIFHIARSVDTSGFAAARLGASRQSSFALTMLEIGGGRLELVQWWPSATAPSSSPAPFVPYAVGAAHVAVTVREVSTELDRLRAAPGVEVLGEPLTFEAGPTPGLTNAFIRISWGILVELVSWPEGDN